MKKILKLFLICILSLTFFGCSSKAKPVEEVGTILKDKGFEVTKKTGLKDKKLIDMVVMLSESDGMIQVVFNGKNISYAYYSIGNDIYVMPEEKLEKPTSTKDLEKEYNDLLKKLDLTHDDIKAYSLDLIHNIRSGYDVQTALKDCKFDGKFEDNKLSYDANLFLQSGNKRFFLNAYFKDDKLGKLVFASSLYSTADKLFVYEDGNITKEDGWISYVSFLDDYKITHDEFVNYLTEVYKAN